MKNSRMEIRERYIQETGKFAHMNGYNRLALIAKAIGVSYQDHLNYTSKSKSQIPTTTKLMKIDQKQEDLASDIKGFYKFNWLYVLTGKGGESEVAELKNKIIYLEKQNARLKGIIEGFEKAKGKLSTTG